MSERDDKVVPIRPPEVLGTIGGIVDESSASLCIYGDDLEPDEVTALLGTKPSSAFRRGHKKGPGSPPSPHGAWFLTVRGESPQGPEDQVRELLMRLPADPDVWEKLHASYRVRIFVGIFMNAWNREFSISSELSAAVGARGLDLDFDIYGDDDEDDIYGDDDEDDV